MKQQNYNDRFRPTDCCPKCRYPALDRGIARCPECGTQSLWEDRVRLFEAKAKQASIARKYILVMFVLQMLMPVAGGHAGGPLVMFDVGIFFPSASNSPLLIAWRVSILVLIATIVVALKQPGRSNAGMWMWLVYSVIAIRLCIVTFGTRDGQVAGLIWIPILTGIAVYAWKKIKRACA